MTEALVGIIHQREEAQQLPVLGAEMSVVGLVGHAVGADPAAFPLNQNVLLNTSNAALLAKLGTGGFLVDAVRGIIDNLGAGQGAAHVIVRRVLKGANDAATIANVLGTANAKTGIYGLEDAAEDLGKTPRIIVPELTDVPAGDGVLSLALTNAGSGYTAAPSVGFSGGGGTGAAATATITKGVGTITVDEGGADYASAPTVIISPPDAEDGVQATATASLTAGAVSSITITNKGKGYVDPPTVTFVGGGGTGAEATAALTGIINTLTITNPGVGYTSAPTVSFTGGSGTGGAATATIGQLANAIVAALPAILGRLKAVAVCYGPSSSYQDWLDWRETIQSDRIIPTYQKVKVVEGESTVERPMSPRVAGIMVRRDHQFDGRPFRSSANQPMYGIVGVAPTVRFSLTDPATTGHDVIANNGGIVVRGEQGVESALSGGGFVYWGTDTCSEDPLWQFYHIVRGRDYIELAQVRALRFFLGRYNLTMQTVLSIIQTINGHLDTLIADGHILPGAKAGYEADQNTPEELRLGFITVNFKAEETPVLRKMTIHSRRDRDALITLSQAIATALDSVG